MSKEVSAQQVNDICRISHSTTLTGEMISSSDIRIDGKFTGKICTKGKLVVGEKALVEGVIVCNSADIWGEVKGEIYVETALSLKSKSVYTGAVKSFKVGIEMGAVFNGTCNIITTEDFKKYHAEYFPALAPKPAVGTAPVVEPKKI